MTDFYDITHEGVRMILPRVTSILKVADPNKADRLMGWAAKLEREAMLAVIEDVLTRPGGPSLLDLHTLWSEIGANLKPKRAWIRKRDEAANIGTAAHDIIRWYIARSMGRAAGPEPWRAGTPEIMRADPVWVAVRAWQEWSRAVEFEPLLSEQTVYCPFCAYAGTLDIYGKVERRLTVVDIKTGRAVYPTYEIQVAAYRHALRREGIQSDGGLILRLPKTAADPGLEVVPAREIPHSAFRSVAVTWRLSRWLDGMETGSTQMKKCEVDG